MANGSLDEMRAAIRARLQEMKISAREASRRAELNVGYLGDFLEGRSRAPESTKLAKLAAVLQLPLGRMTDSVGGQRTASLTNSKELPRHSGMVPLLSVEAPVSDDMPIMPIAALPVGHVPTIPALEHITGAYAFTIANRSNEPRYLLGEIIYISPVAVPREGDFVFLRLKDGRGGPTQLLKMEGKRVVVRALKSKKSSSHALEDIATVHRIVASVG